MTQRYLQHLDQTTVKSREKQLELSTAMRCLDHKNQVQQHFMEKSGLTLDFLYSTELIPLNLNPTRIYFLRLVLLQYLQIPG